MSLDAWLTGPSYEEECKCRDCDNKHIRTTRDTYYSLNITHNLVRMAGAAGLYDCMWRPDEKGLTNASQLIEPLAAGLKTLLADPGRFKAMNPKNGWGSYDGFVPVVREYLAAYKEYPDADVNVSR